VFGAELPPENPIYFPKGSKFAIFTWHKATVVINGKYETKYTSTDTRMPEYLEIHGNIQEDRDNSRLRREPGPNVVVCGSSNCGKSTVWRILTNYSLKMGYRPIFIDLDIECNEIVPSGWIGATRPKLPLPNDDMADEVICLYYGFRQQNMVKELYRKQLTELADLVESKIKNKKSELDKEYADLAPDKSQIDSIKAAVDPYSTSLIPSDLAAGCIINTMVTSYENPVKTIKKIVKLFQVDYIIIIDFEQTYIKLTEDYKNNRHLKIIKLPKSPGVVTTGETHKTVIKNASYKNYFNGKMGKFDTFEVGLDLEEYKLYTIEIVKIPLSALPMGAKQDTQKIMVKHADPKNMPLQNRVVGVLDPFDLEKLRRLESEVFESDSSNKEEFYDIIIKSLCRSLVHVSYYDAEKNQLIVNATSPDGLKSKYLIVGDLTYEKDI
jgi:polyribonucleotide 5'-hydroxyl-kinase